MTSARTEAVPTPANLEPGQTLPPLTVSITRADLVRYAGASTDFNPIHYSDRFAVQVGLPGVVAHGMFTLGLALRVVTAWAPAGSRVVSASARFARPVVVPDDDAGAELVITGTIVDRSGDSGPDINSGTVTIGLDAVADGQKVLAAARVVLELASAEHPQ